MANLIVEMFLGFAMMMGIWGAIGVVILLIQKILTKLFGWHFDT